MKGGCLKGRENKINNNTLTGGFIRKEVQKIINNFYDIIFDRLHRKKGCERVPLFY